MASTRNKNSKVDYDLFNRQNQGILDNRVYKSRRFAELNAMPGFGINVGHMPNTLLSNNAIDVESRLYGINATNLVTPQRDLTVESNTLPTMNFFDRPKLFLPEPLAIEKSQRPIKPF